MIDGISGGRIDAAFTPSAVSCTPRRRNHPTMQKMMLVTKGMRQPQLETCAGTSRELTSQAEPEPSMKPIVTPAAVELLTIPRVNAEDASVVKTIEPVNSPPTENPWISRMRTNR